MSFFEFILGFSLIAVFISGFLKSANLQLIPEAGPQEETTPSDDKKDYSQAYQRKYIFSRNEKSEYRKLATWAQEQGYDVFPKMRLLDIIEPRKDADNQKSLRWKIQSKHVDFVVCDQECRVKFIIELDDNSHNQQTRKERDMFVDQACRGAGYTVLHTRAISEEFLKGLQTDEKEKEPDGK